MKNFSKLMVLSLTFILSCKKEKTTEVKAELPDVIVYNDIRDTTARTIRTTTPVLGAPCNNLVPSDSGAYLKLDLDKDGIADFTFGVSHSRYNSQQYCGHCQAYSYSIRITPLNSACRVAVVAPVAGANARGYKLSAQIAYEHHWSEISATCYVSQCGFNIPFEGPYYGLIINNKIGWVRMVTSGSNGITVQEAGYNETWSNSIKAGQKQ